jgi:LuxR family maltose regulon positive regulatory protein
MNSIQSSYSPFFSAGTIPGYFRPARAVDKLSAAQSTVQPVYICGITGMGKTALVEDFLRDREYTFCSMARKEESLPDLLSDTTGIVIIDDLMFAADLHVRMTLYETINQLILRGTWVILCSRSPVPAWLMPVYVSRNFLVISEGDMKLTAAEAERMIACSGFQFDPLALGKVYDQFKGYPLHLHLLILALQKCGEKEPDIQRLAKQAERECFAYADVHVFGRWDQELLDFIMKLSIVNSFDAGIAGHITGRGDAAKCLEIAMEICGMLSETDGVYFWKYGQRAIRHRLDRNYTKEQVNTLYYNAGLYLEMHNDYRGALIMYRQAEDNGSIARLLVSNAKKNPANGFYFEFRKYYLKLSREAVRKSIPLMAGMSMLQSILLNEEESEYWYLALSERTEKSTGSEQMEARSWLLYLDIALSQRGTDKIAGLLKYAASQIMENNIDLPELSVTSNLPSLMNGGKDFSEWSRHDRALAATVGPAAEIALGKYGKGLVNLALAESCFEKGEKNEYVLRMITKGRMQAEAGGKKEQLFVAAGLLCRLFTVEGYAQDALDVIESFIRSEDGLAEMLLDNAAALRCRTSMYLADRRAVMDWFGKAPDENDDFCTMLRYQYLTKVRVYILQRKYHKAQQLLERLMYYAEKANRPYIRIECGILQAVVFYRLDQPEWIRFMQNSITEAERYHFIRVFSAEAGLLLPLLKSEELIWKDKGFQGKVLRDTRFMASRYPDYLEGQTGGRVLIEGNALTILRYQAEGMTTRQIANIMSLTESTVKYHSSENYRKLGVQNRTSAINEGKRRGLL